MFRTQVQFVLCKLCFYSLKTATTSVPRSNNKTINLYPWKFFEYILTYYTNFKECVFIFIKPQVYNIMFFFLISGIFIIFTGLHFTKKQIRSSQLEWSDSHHISSTKCVLRVKQYITKSPGVLLFIYQDSGMVSDLLE